MQFYSITRAREVRSKAGKFLDLLKRVLAIPEGLSFRLGELNIDIKCAVNGLFKVPWHGSGKTAPKGLTTRETIEITCLGWEVRLRVTRAAREVKCKGEFSR